MGGSSTVGSKGGQPGIYGTLGSAAIANIPGGRDSAVSWTDKSGQVWIYGGEGIDGKGTYGPLDDLWKLDPTTSEWAWMNGSSNLPASCATDLFCGWPAIYGELSVPARGVGPGSRVGSAGWTD